MKRVIRSKGELSTASGSSQAPTESAAPDQDPDPFLEDVGRELEKIDPTIFEVAESEALTATLPEPDMPELGSTLPQAPRPSSGSGELPAPADPETTANLKEALLSGELMPSDLYEDSLERSVRDRIDKMDAKEISDALNRSRVPCLCERRHGRDRRWSGRVLDGRGSLRSWLGFTCGLKASGP